MNTQKFFKQRGLFSDFTGTHGFIEGIKSEG